MPTAKDFKLNSAQFSCTILHYAESIAQLVQATARRPTVYRESISRERVQFEPACAFSAIPHGSLGVPFIKATSSKFAEGRGARFQFHSDIRVLGNSPALGPSLTYSFNLPRRSIIMKVRYDVLWINRVLCWKKSVLFRCCVCVFSMLHVVFRCHDVCFSVFKLFCV